MAAGSKDINGIYFFGEDDPLSPFADLLNKLSQSVSDVVATRLVGVLTNGHAEISADAGLTTSSTPIDVAGLSITVNTMPGRRYRLSTMVGVQSTVAADRAGLFLREGTTNLVGMGVYCSNANVGNSAYLEIYLTPTTGSHTYKVGLARNSGTGTVGIDGGGSNPCHITIEDVGAA